jgi:hypothetical protein
LEDPIADFIIVEVVTINSTVIIAKRVEKKDQCCLHLASPSSSLREAEIILLDS